MKGNKDALDASLFNYTGAFLKLKDRITAHPRGAFISVGDWTHTETNLLSLTT